MKEITVNKKFFKDYTYDPSHGAESTRFYNDENYIKIINKRLLKDDREKIIRNLYYFDNPDIIKPEFILKEKGEFIGYGMDFLKDYTTLAYHLDVDEPDFEERKELMIRISKIFDYFDKKFFAYYDIHSFNVLYNNGDIKLIDLDGGILRPYINGKADYNLGIRIAKKSLVRYALSTMYDISLYELMVLNKLKNRKYFQTFLDSLPNDVRKLYDYALEDTFHLIFGITPALDKITQTMSEDTNEIIEKKLRNY